MSDTIDKLKKQYLKAKNAYYNDDSSSLTDAEYDRLEDSIRKLDPSWPELGKTGVSVKNKKSEIALSRFMPSLNKAYPEAVGKWLAKNPSPKHLVLDKLDGSSLQVVYVRGKIQLLATRGDGTNGGNITFLAPHLNLPDAIRSNAPTTIFRCEAVISKRNFKKWAAEFDNPRNMVNGLLNRRTPHPALKDVDIVVLGCYGMKLQSGLAYADQEGLKTVNFSTVDLASEPADKLTVHLARRLDKSIYEMDGLVLAPTNFVFEYKNADKPKGVIAFKVNADDETVEATVSTVVWQLSGRGRIIPKIEIKPTVIGGVTVTYCTSHNAVWMMDRKIGPGAVVRLVRSGGVIPKIVGVTKPAKRMLLPDVPYTTKGVHFVVTEAKATDATKKAVQVERTVKFMTTLGIEFLAAKTIEKAYEVLPSPMDYLHAWHTGYLPDSLTSVGVGPGMAAKIEDEFNRVLGKPVPTLKMMVASQTFGVGIGERKLQQLVDAGISLSKLTLSNSEGAQWRLRTSLGKVHGFSDKTVELLMSGLDAWRDFHAEATAYVQIKEQAPAKKVTGGAWAKHNVSFTGYRDKEQEAAVVAGGGEVVPFGSKTTVLFIREGGKASSKIDKARDKGITVTTFEGFKP